MKSGSTKKQSVKQQKKPDIHAVAARAKVSIATVSRVLNKLPTVDPVLATRVWKAVNELGYLPDTMARALVSGKSRLFGVIVSEITNPFFPELVQKFENAAIRHGYEILIASTSNDALKMESCVRRMLERKVDGVAVMTFGFEEAVLDRFAAGHVPVVFVDVESKQPRSSRLAVNYGQGIYEAVQHLAVLGHRKIGFISGPLNLASARARKESFVACLRGAGVKPKEKWLVEGDHTLEGGRDAMKKILASEDRPTAILCSNDMTAIGVQHALFDAKLRVPEDFSLVGFDDIHLAEYTIPPLTTVRMSCEDIAEGAVASLLKHLETPNEKPEAIAIPTKLVVRQTTGIPAGALGDLKKKR